MVAPLRIAPALIVLGIALALAPACNLLSEEIELAPAEPAPSGPVVARVAGEDLRLDEVAPLARLALELRAAQGLPAGELSSLTLGDQVGLATELLALAAEARGAGAAARADVAEGEARLLARLLLDRATRAVDARPVGEEELARRHAEEVERFATQGSSGLFDPTRVDAVVVSAAPFPDRAAHQGQPGLLTREQVSTLLEALHRDIGERADDLDAFLAMAWSHARGQPCLRIESVWAAPLEPALSPLPPPVAAVLAGLDGQGAVSKVAWNGDSAFLVRRGGSRPGRGETLESARASLETAIRRDRRRAAGEEMLSTLRRRYEVQVWPARLSSGS